MPPNGQASEPSDDSKNILVDMQKRVRYWTENYRDAVLCLNGSVRMATC